MIKANELRVGNYFNEISRHTEIHLPTISIFKIVEIHLFEVETIHYDVDILKTNGYHTIKMKDLSPIPLTPEILEKCGAFYNNDNWLIGVIELNHTTTEEYFEFEFTNPIMKWEIIPIKYLHQLQNLYFALTGQELEIKLPQEVTG